MDGGFDGCAGGGGVDGNGGGDDACLRVGGVTTRAGGRPVGFL